MSPTALRWVAVPLGLLGFALRQVVTFWLIPLTWRAGFGLGLLLLAIGLLVAVAIPFGIFALLYLPDRRPARLEVRDGRPTAPPSGVYAGSQAIMWMFLGGQLVLTERVPYGDSMRLAQIPFAWLGTTIGVGLASAVALAFLLIQRPILYLDPQGLTIKRLWGTTRIAWDEVVPGDPAPPLKQRPRRLPVRLRGRYGVEIPVGWLHIDAAFLADTIRHYVEHPQERAAIGTR
jgi:hypothetical protein